MTITLSNPKVHEDYTSQLAPKKFRARSTGSLGSAIESALNKFRAYPAGSLGSAIESAAYNARKFQRDFFCYPGSSYGDVWHVGHVWHVSYKSSDYLNVVSTGDSVLSVSPDMTVTVHEVTRERKKS